MSSSREIEFSLSEAHRIFQQEPLSALSRKMYLTGNKMVNNMKWSPLTRPFGILLKGASKGIIETQSTIEGLSYAGATIGAMASIFALFVTAPGFVGGVALFAGGVLTSAVTAPYICSTIAAAAQTIASIPKSIINIPQSFSDSAFARRQEKANKLQKVEQDRKKAEAEMKKQKALEATRAQTLIAEVTQESAETRTAIFAGLSEKFPTDFCAAAKKIEDRTANMQGILTAPTKLMAKPITVVRKDTTTP